MSRWRRPATAALLAATLLAWGGHAVVAGHRAEQWRAVQRRAGVEAALADPAWPATVEALRRRAMLRSTHYFPPDHPGAIADLAAALHRAPLDSGTWFLLAEQLIYSGRTAAATAALDHADRLDPMFPTQRLRAAQLWDVLGEHDKARRHASMVAGLSPDLRRQAVRDLLRMGIEEPEVALLVGLPTAPAAEWPAVLRLLRSGDAAANRAVLETLRADHPSNASLVEPLMQFAMEPLLADWVERLWQLADPTVEQQTGAWLADPRLAQPPFGRGVNLGWQRSPNGPLAAAWLAPDAMGSPHGIISLQHAGPGKLSAAQPVHRLLLHPGPARTLTLALRHVAADPRRPNAWLEGAGSGWKQRGEPQRLGPAWQHLALALPAIDDAQLVTLTLHLRGEQSSDEAAQMGPLEVLP